MLAALDEQGAGSVNQPGEEGAAQPKPKKDEPAPGADEDPDGDKGFETESKAWQMPEGVKKRIATLTEQRNKAREAEKGYDFFKPYANDKGRQYLQTLVQFDGLLEQAMENNPWLADLVKKVVVEGKGTAADKRAILAALSEEAAGGEAEPGADAAAGAADPTDPREKQLKDLLAWKESVEKEKRAAQEQAQRRQQVDREKEAYRAEIADFAKANPQFKDDKEFTRLALQVSAARNISYTEAAKAISAYMTQRESAALGKLAKVDQDRGGAAVETPGRGGVPVKSRPAIGSDEEAEAMAAYFGGDGR